ncbi:hypothetical protein N072000002_13670 [Clostridium tetani]|uniref:CRISPR type III-associated protein domain-containing protein n=1 Tax=Clostridium tetani TaxID=1513 RepID=A0ABC8EDG3_CLOTA|nr:type III-B CRISPR module RAMP protein Cmr1 [Clostridium tetani]BDR81187.1 hypothetical protein K234311028_14330 [Clostridium tetani]BDR89566.1 hypothetical protein N072000002_13670 [Clostridium tetani]
MKYVKLELEVITPMFSFGDNKKLSQFRITELKSLMRNTFRQIYCFNKPENMKKKEDILFGSTKNKSPISFKLNSPIIGNGERNMLPHRETRCRESKTNCISESTIIKNLYMIVNNNSDMELYINLLIQSSILDGIGKRSRKGFGAFKINSISGINEEYNYLLKKSPVDVLKECEIYLKDNDLYKVRKNRYRNNKIEKLIFDDSLYIKNKLNFPYIKNINFIKISKNRDYTNLIKLVSQLTHDRLDDKVIKEDNKIIIDPNILGNCKSGNRKINRFASPICVSFWENNIDKYMIVKELNYDYILSSLKTKYDKSINFNKRYVDEYVEKMIEIGGIKSK